ncbi:MAG: FprA family A-type flavoprotein [Chloroflexi bacterium]|nr:FprA family A-type flavoprotein [Chloroflexota bacterium]
MYKAVIIYDSRKGHTESIARSIEQGLRDSGVDVNVKKATGATANDLSDADAIVLGSPTYHGEMMASIRAFLFEMEKADLRGKVGAAFGSYGWSGEAVPRMTETMKHVFGMNVVEPGLNVLERQSDPNISREFGKKIGESAQQRRK